MQNSLRIAALTVILALLLSTQVFAFINVAGGWEQCDDPNYKSRLYITQGTNGQILSLFGYVHFYYSDYDYFRSNDWVCPQYGQSFLWDLRITQKNNFVLYRDGPFPATCTVSFSASSESSASYALNGPEISANGDPIREFTRASGALRRISVDNLVENGSSPASPPIGPLAYGSVGNSTPPSGGDPKDPTGGITPPPPSPDKCPPPNGQLPTLLPGGQGSPSVIDPVNIVSGNFFLSETDLHLKSRLPLHLIRNYNSLDKEIGLFGRGWSSILNARLQINDNSVYFFNADGSALVFNKSGDSYITPVGHDVKLTHLVDAGLWSLAIPQGSEWFFNESGQIIRMVKACCGGGATDAIDFEYDALNNLFKITNPAGQWFQLSQTAGLVTTIADSAGRSVSYEYNSNKDLVNFTGPTGLITNYLYDEAGNLTQITKPAGITTNLQYTEGKVVKVINPDRSVNLFTWDQAAKQMTLTDGNSINHLYTFDDSWQLASYSIPAANAVKSLNFAGSTVSGFTDSLGNSITYQYNSDGYLAAGTDKLGNTTTFTWHPALKKLTGKTDALGRTWSYEWCARGNLIREIDQAGNITRYTYDSHSNRTSKTDPMGRVTRYIYDSTGNWLFQTVGAMGGVSSFSYDLRGNMLASTDALGRTTAYLYDLLDRLIKTVYPDGRHTQVVYDEAGNIASRIDNLNRTTAYTYDAAGRMLTTTRPDGSIISHAYDASGRKISSTDALGRVTGYEYDALGNLVKVAYPDQTCQTYIYDTEKRLISSSDELGNVTAYEYDPMGRMLATIDPAGARYENTYDVAGRKVATKDPLGRTTTWVYDVLDRVTKTTAPDQTFSLSSYDAVGNLLISTNALNQKTVYEYDALNRQIRTTRPGGAQFMTAYDAAGQVIAETDALGNTTGYTFNTAGRRLSTTNALNHVWQYAYDNAGRLARTVDPLNASSTISYDIMDRAVAETDALGRNIETVRADSTTANKFDAAGQLLEMKHYRLVPDKDCGKHKKGKKNEPAYKEEILALRQYAYDLAGNRVSMTDEDGRATVYAYDGSNWLKQVDYPGNQRVSYTYNDAGDRLSEQTGSNPAVQYAYDAAGRMIGRGSESFSYDADGNMLTDAVATYTWNSDNRLVRVEKTLDACKHDKYRHGFGYGHLKHGKETTLYEEYSYLPEDWRRVSRKSGKYELSVRNRGFCHDNEEETFVSVYDGDDESQEYQLGTSRTGHHNKKEVLRLNLLREFISGPLTDDLEHTRYNRLSLAMLKDGLGSTIAITGREAKVLADIDYDAWGNFRNQGKDSDLPCRHEDFDNYLDRFENTRSFGRANHNKKAFGKYFADRLTPYLYTGRRYSDLTSQYFNRNRYYSPTLARFTSKDPIGFNGGNNLYRYADNNPVLLTDPSGLIWVFHGWIGWDHTQISNTGGHSGAGLQAYYYVRYLDIWKARFIWVENPLCNSDPSTPVGTTRIEIWPRFKFFEGPHFLSNAPFHTDNSPNPADQASGKIGHTELSPPLPHY
ncbi:MAG TPA: DUF6531 domain-containing protein [Candidatus Rifleibacterium sp.]|nr:DUF6531 domain-containing protein [Candidatus Rifleibacterium sp.]HPT46464.1 DUF6531 domain-containing protein [Candidatus Rifleibacterium sp.]